MRKTHRTRILRIFAGAVVACGFLVFPSAHSDTVTLDNGKTLEGRVTDDGATVTIEMAQGVVKLSKSRVVAIEPKTTLPDEYAQRSRQIRKQAEDDGLNAQAQSELWFQLAMWAGEKRLQMARTEALKKTIELNPDHAAARKESGFVYHDGRWMTMTERNQSMGMVMLEGKWVPKEAYEDARRLKEEREQRERDAEADRRLKQAATEKLEAEKRLLDARRDEIATERYRYAYRTPIWSGFDCAGPSPIFPPTVIRRGPLAGPVLVAPDLSKPFLQVTR